MTSSFLLASTSLPSLTTTSPVAEPAKGASRPVRASCIALSRTAFAANMTDAPALAAVAEPKDAWDVGNLVSPSRTVTFSGGRPSVSAATCCSTV